MIKINPEKAPCLTHESSIEPNCVYWISGPAGNRNKFYYIMKKCGKKRAEEFEIFYEKERDAFNAMRKLAGGEMKWN